ncbi:MAG: coenzyme F420-0:L-glutamate ligase [Candidatus Lokiarchaeota archaeon]|nr:coenzyme F420-0:L-glutamate ligase [Candidatus Harpocratesius repetitus]
MLTAIGLKTTHIIKQGEDLFTVLCDTFEANTQFPKEKSILVIAETVVGTCQNRIIRLSDVKNYSLEAEELSQGYNLDPKFAELVIQEADEIIGGIPGMLFTLKSGILIANAGIDKSNAGDEDQYSLWPSNPFNVAAELCQEIKSKYELKDFGVIISDSRVQPLRRGIVGVAIGVAGFKPIIDCRGRCDLYGHKMEWTTRAIADQITDLAHILMGECDEQTPFILVNNVPVNFTNERIDPQSMIMPKKEDLFSRIFNF